MTEITIRPFTPDDTDAIFRVFLMSVNDLLQRQRLPPMADMSDPDSVAREWRNNRGMLLHFIETGDRCYVAERNGEIIGYARSIVRDNVRQLTEYFIVPGSQSAGVGRELLARTFPADEKIRRVVLSTTDARAVARYLKSGVYPLHPICFFLQSNPQVSSIDTDLKIEPLQNTANTLEQINAIDRVVLGYTRQIDHEWFLTDPDRSGFGFWRAGRLAAYAYVGFRNGPMAVLNPDDFPAVLAFGENHAAENGKDFDIALSLTNRAAVSYLLSRRALIETEFTVYLMAEQPLGQYDQYVFTSPDFMT